MNKFIKLAFGTILLVSMLISFAGVAYADEPSADKVTREDILSEARKNAGELNVDWNQLHEMAAKHIVESLGYLPKDFGKSTMRAEQYLTDEDVNGNLSNWYETGVNFNTVVADLQGEALIWWAGIDPSVFTSSSLVENFNIYGAAWDCGFDYDPQDPLWGGEGGNAGHYPADAEDAVYQYDQYACAAHWVGVGVYISQQDVSTTYFGSTPIHLTSYDLCFGEF